MRIFINALSARLGGGQTYLKNLLRHFPQSSNTVVFVLIQPLFRLTDFPDNVVLVEQKGLENPIKRAIWELYHLPKLLKQYDIDVFFSPGGLIPRTLPSSVSRVVTFQNMLPFDHVQRAKYSYGYRRFRDWLLEWGLASSMRNADLVIFISEFARQFIQQELGFLKGKSIVVPHGIHSVFRVNPHKPLKRPNWLSAGDYFLYVSWIDYYKGQLEIVRGFNLYRQQGGEGTLLLVGAEYKPYADIVRREISNLGLSEVVKMVGNIPHDELPALYQNARINIFASFTENCPNILLEMMASGRPCLVSNRGPMPEFGENVVDYFDPSNPYDFSQTLAKLLVDEKYQSHLSSAAIKLVENFTWEKASNLTWNAIIELQRNNYTASCRSVIQKK